MFLTEEEKKEEELKTEGEEDEENGEKTEEYVQLGDFSEEEAKELLTTMGLSEGEVDQWVQNMKKGEIGPFPVIKVDEEKVEKSLPKLDLERPFEGVGDTLDKLTELGESIRKLESGLILNLTEWVREIKEKILSLKKEITTQFIERLKLRMFKKFIEKSYEDAVISSFEPVETETLAEYIQRLGKIFREYKEDITLTEEVLRKTILEQEKLMREHIGLLRKEEEKLREEIKLLESKVGSADEVLELREDLARVGEENKGLKMRMQDLENIKTNLEEELGKLRGAGDAVEEQVAKMRELDEKLGELRISKSRLEEELNRTKIDLNEKSKLLETADTEIENLKSELITLRPKATEELESMRKKIEEMKMKEKQTREETNEMRQKISALEKELSEKEEMLGEIGEFAAKEEDYKRRLMGLDEMKEKINAQRKAISTMKIVVKDEPKFKILFACQEVGDRGLSEEEIKKSLGVPLPLVQRYIKELMDLELLKEERGRYSSMI